MLQNADARFSAKPTATRPAIGTVTQTAMPLTYRARHDGRQRTAARPKSRENSGRAVLSNGFSEASTSDDAKRLERRGSEGGRRFRLAVARFRRLGRTRWRYVLCGIDRHQIR